MNNQQQNTQNPQENVASFFFSDPGKMADSSYEQNLRRSIIAIHNDSNLTAAQKAKKIQVP